ncbi:hypothetical protein G7054_g2965 [Neopestalotiopsis clavispora]|nr:hypothetical protein G7054_g2965 [Neopestalotiopsis clavispora]
MGLNDNNRQEAPEPTPATNDSESNMNDTDKEVKKQERKPWPPVYHPDIYSQYPMKMPLTAPWDLPISDADMEKLETGFKAQCMEDKWDFLIEKPDKSGNMSLHIIRNWLKWDFWVLHIVPKSSGNDGKSAIIQSITWEGKKPMGRCDAEHAKKEAVIMCRGWLGCEFETLPEYPSGVVFDHDAHTKETVA